MSRAGYLPLKTTASIRAPNWERFDLFVRRVEYLEIPGDHTQEFRERAASLGGYDITNIQKVLFNGPEKHWAPCCHRPLPFLISGS